MQRHAIIAGAQLAFGMRVSSHGRESNIDFSQENRKMAAVGVTITGKLYDRINRTTQNVVLIGDAHLTDLEVGGGPILPGGGWPGGPDEPPPRPQPRPPGIWGPTDPRPTPPIALPPKPVDPPVDPQPPGDLVVKPPPEGGGWAYVSAWGWGYFPGDNPVGGPKR